MPSLDIMFAHPRLLGFTIEQDLTAHQNVSCQCLLRSTEVRCEFFRSSRILEDLECNFWKTDVKSCSGKTVLMTPSKMTMTSLLFKLGNWSISKSIASPALLVSLPITLLSSSDKLEKRAALAATHVRCF